MIATTDSPALKVCSKCHQSKPLVDFYTYSNGRPRARCKACMADDTREWRRRNPETVRETARKWNVKAYRRTRHLQKRFGIELVDYWAMLDAQGFMCGVCGDALEPLAEEWRHKPQIDHCHESGQVRMILCGLCNRMLGQGLDCPDRLRAGAEYLEAFQC